MHFVCVIDMDETLGHFDDKNHFYVRPYIDLLINFLMVANIDIILWSNGSDSYVEHVVNNYLLTIAKGAYKIFGRSQCKYSERKYGYLKYSDVIRKLYWNPIIVIGIDDQVNRTMDDGYDYRIYALPYLKENLKDDEILNIMDKVVNYCKKIKFPDNVTNS